jgi:hypothetical protein
MSSDQMIDEIRRLWLERWTLLEEQQSLVAEIARRVEEHGGLVEQLRGRVAQDRQLELIEEHRQMIERHEVFRVQLAHGMDRFFGGSWRRGPA